MYLAAVLAEIKELKDALKTAGGGDQLPSSANLPALEVDLIEPAVPSKPARKRTTKSASKPTARK